MDSGLHSPLAVLRDGDEQCRGRLRCFTEGRSARVSSKILNDKQLFLPDVAGNKLFHGYSNLETNPKVGLIFLIPGHDNTVRINGRVKVIDRAELKDVQLEVFNADERAEILQGLLIEVEESYSHCPRALKFSKLWDTEQIAKNIVAPPLPTKEPGLASGWLLSREIGSSRLPAK